MSDRTFRVDRPPMEGKDIRNWQHEVPTLFGRMQIPYPLKADGVYGVATRSATASLCRASGLVAAEEMEHGVTPELRSKLRNRPSGFTATELRRFRSADLVEYRRRLRLRHEGASVASPLAKIITDDWGWHPGVHDGIDLICAPNAVGHAICDGTVVRADNSGWWGRGAPANPAVRARGDGVLVLRCSTNAGPFRPGLNFVYGHAEGMIAKVGQKVRAGEPICHAGLANAWHFHMCVNGRDDTKGVGDRDPRQFVDYAVKHG